MLCKIILCKQVLVQFGKVTCPDAMCGDDVKVSNTWGVFRSRLLLRIISFVPTAENKNDTTYT